EAKVVMSGRIRALSQAYAMMAAAKWEGALLQKIIERQIGGMSSRIKVTGCEVIVVPSAAQQFAMIIHELTTNALKYGALSAPEGSVSIEGKIDRSGADGVLWFAWKEIGGPTVSPPIRRGFGSVILLDSAKYFAEDVSMDYLPAGLVYGLKIRLSVIEASPRDPSYQQSVRREEDAIA